MKNKRILALLLAAAMTAGLAACGGKESGSEGSGEGGYDQVTYAYATFNNIPAEEDLDTVEEAINEITREKINVEVTLMPIAIADYPKFKVSDIEFHLPQPSYTIDTLHTLSRTYPERDFYFIMGADNWTIFPRWRKHEEILREYPILIYPRKGFDILIPDAYPNVKKVDAPLMEISSTFIREAFRAGKDIRFFLPEGVRPYLTPETSPLNPPVSSGSAGTLRNPSASPDNEP